MKPYIYHLPNPQQSKRNRLALRILTVFAAGGMIVFGAIAAGYCFAR